MAGHKPVPSGPLAPLTQLDALLRNDAIYELGRLVDEAADIETGRPLTYPGWIVVLYESLIAVHRSARRVDSEHSHPIIWNLIREASLRRFSDDPGLQAPVAPVRRHHYLYARDRYLVPLKDQMRRRFEEISSAQATSKLGLLEEDGPGSITHPDPTRMLYGDGKVITPLYRAKSGDTKIDKSTGEVTEARADPDAKVHVVGSGEMAFGVKHVIVAARGSGVHQRMILSYGPVTKAVQEVDVALDRVHAIRGHVPGSTGLLYDGALRGKHIATLLRDEGLIPVSPVTAYSGGRRRKRARVERVRLLGPVRASDGTEVQVFTERGAPCAGVLDVSGDLVLLPLERLRLEMRRNADGTYRWYGTYGLPESIGRGTIRLRLDTTEEDKANKRNRSEHLRPIPPSDPDFKALYSQRADAESINRQLDDTCWLTRAHSVGADRQSLNVLGYALVVNSIALYLHGRANAPPEELAA